MASYSTYPNGVYFQTEMCMLRDHNSAPILLQTAMGHKRPY